MATKNGAMACSREQLKQLALDHAWKKRPVALDDAKFVVGITPKGDALAIPPKSNDMIDRPMLQAMFQEAKTLGCTGKLYVYGAVTTMSEAGRFNFIQINPRTCTVLG